MCIFISANFSFIFFTRINLEKNLAESGCKDSGLFFISKEFLNFFSKFPLHIWHSKFSSENKFN